MDNNFYTDDFDQEMLDWLTKDRPTKCGSRYFNSCHWNTKHDYLKKGVLGEIWTANNIGYINGEEIFTKLTKQEFKRHLGMPEEETTMDKLEDGIFYFTNDFDESMMEFVKEKWGGVDNWGFNQNDTALVVSTESKPYTSNCTLQYSRFLSKQLTKQQFKELIGMTNKQFTKDDLKTGHLVVLRNGEEYVVFKDVDCSHDRNNTKDVLVALKEYNWLYIRRYTEELKHNCNSVGDIMRVYIQTSPHSFIREYEPDKRKLLWKREEKSEKDLQIEELQGTITQAQEQINKLKEMK